MEELSYLKISPREQEENKLLLFRGEKLYERATGESRQAIDHALLEFERVLDSGDRVAIAKARRALAKMLDEAGERWDLS